MLTQTRLRSVSDASSGWMTSSRCVTSWGSLHTSACCRSRLTSAQTLADAGTILLRQGGVCLINSHNKVGRRRLALAHELGHYLIADDYTIDWRVADQHASDIEARLDRFGRVLLLPETGVRSSWARAFETHDLREAAVLVASDYRVDMATLRSLSTWMRHRFTAFTERWPPSLLAG